jgi:putative ABC transport system permease protein
MNLREALNIATRSLRANKLRSLLTTVGIVIGVTAVIVLVGLGDGMKAGFNKTFGELATAVIVQKVQGQVPGGGAAKELKDGDVVALNDKRKAPSLNRVIPLLSGSVIMQRFGEGIQFNGTINGSTTEYLTVNNREVVAGTMFTATDEKNRARVLLLGPKPLQTLYGGDANAAVGSSLRLGRVNFKVIGTLRSDGNFDDIALMPLETARAYQLGGTDTITSMAAKANSVAQVDSAVAEVTRVLDDRHRISDPAKRDFKVTALQNQLDKINQFLTFMTLFIVAVAGISLIVGAIGVANIMLVSVTERTREIGIRKAIGARKSAIMKQFLIESTVLAGLGGVIGIVVGVAITLTIATVLPKYAPDFGAPTVSAPAIIIAFTTSLIIGLVAGGYPALRAARLRPIEALRYQ